MCVYELIFIIWNLGDYIATEEIYSHILSVLCTLLIDAFSLGTDMLRSLIILMMFIIVRTTLHLILNQENNHVYLLTIK